MLWNKNWLVVAFLGLAAVGVSAAQARAQDLLTSQAVWAVVKGGGGLGRNNGGVGATTNKLGTGTYEVGFERSVVGCIFSANIGQPGFGSSSPGEITIVQRAGNNNGVFVQTYNSNGALADRPFHVEIDCP